MDCYYLPQILLDDKSLVGNKVKKRLQGAFRHYSNVFYVNPLSANPTKWSNTPKQFTVCLTILWGWRLEVKFEMET